MKRIWATTMLLALMMAAGCQTSSTKHVYYVMFAKTPKLFGTQVFLMGETVGDIVSQEASANNVVRVTVSIRAEHSEKIQDNLVAFVKNGQLQLYQIAVVGSPLPHESKILGFRSKMALRAFRFSHSSALLRQAASEKANHLYEASK